MLQSLCKFLAVPSSEDDISFLRLYNSPARGLGKKFIEKLDLTARQQELSLYKALEKNIGDNELAKKVAVEFIVLVQELKAIPQSKSISDLVKDILDKSGLSELYRKDGDEERLENIKKLVNGMIVLENENKDTVSIEEYLQEVSLFTDLDAAGDAHNKVNLMTIHISKGLEFPYVLLCGFTEGVLPSAMSIKERRERALEEERRLTYVAVTRAEKRFYMTESEGFNFNSGLNKVPSRFLFEISDELYVRKGELSQEIIDAAALGAGRSAVGNLEIFNTGDLVSHDIWKKGVVKEVNFEKGEYIIDFFETGKQKPIEFSFQFLKRISDGENSTGEPNSAKDLKIHLQSQANPFEESAGQEEAPVQEIAVMMRQQLLEKEM